MNLLIEKCLNNLKENSSESKEYSKIYKNLHKYWARKPWNIVEEYIKEYSNEKDTVMDVFSGSGVTGLESIINNRNFIGYDLNPLAIAVSECTVKYDFDFNVIKSDFEKIVELCKDEIMKMYESEDYCQQCGNLLHFKYVLNGPKYAENPIGRLYCSECNSKVKVAKRILTYNEIKKMKNYHALTDIPYWYPNNEFPKEFHKDRFSYKGIKLVSDMFTKRNLLSAALLLNTIINLNSKYEDLYTMAFTNTILHISKLKGENVRPLGVNNYWIPDDHIEENPWFRFENRFNNVIESKRILNDRISKNHDNIGKATFYNKSTVSLVVHEEPKADYIFTDPPYGEAIQYSELSYVWNSWLKKDYIIEEEVIINPKQGKGNEEFSNLLSLSLKNIYDLLKPEKHFTLCFQNKDFLIWKDVLSTCKKIGFQLWDVRVYDTFGNPYNGNWSKFSPKSDIYVTFKKTNISSDVQLFSNNNTLDEIVFSILNDINTKNIELDTIKIYDLVISYLIWDYYYNDNPVEIEKFTTKCLFKIVDDWFKLKSNNQYEFQNITEATHPNLK